MNYSKENISIYNEILNFRSYTPFLEDLILFGFLYDIKNGFYIDVGANDPNDESVTKYFYLKGWNGINIEPLDDKYHLLEKERQKDINLNIVASEKKENKTFYIYKGLSTTRKNYSRPYFRKTIVRAERMIEICKKYVPKNIQIQFCKIDVEGSERDVLLGFDFKNYRPKIFCIESTVPLKLIPTQHEFEDILFKNNYSFVYQYKINRFYIDDEYNYLKRRVSLIEKIIKIYKFKNNKNNFIK